MFYFSLSYTCLLKTHICPSIAFENLSARFQAESLIHTLSSSHVLTKGETGVLVLLKSVCYPLPLGML